MNFYVCEKYYKNIVIKKWFIRKFKNDETVLYTASFHIQFKKSLYCLKSPELPQG